MKVVRTAIELREALARASSEGRTIGFVPTMGALHEGHLSLVRASRKDCDVVVLSIFVNPLQFGPTEDLDAYPRNEERDLERARSEKVDVVFVPTVGEMYPEGRSATVSVRGVAEPLEGMARPGHFDGVATVVAKLFNLVQPARAYFGQKDAQQVAVVKQMTRDLSFPVRVVVCPTVREPDGLALSSRNAYLSAEDRVRAVSLFRALETGRQVLIAGGNWEVAEKAMGKVFEGADGVLLEYARAVDPETFASPTETGPVLLVAAARVGGTRLIDNMLVEGSA
ncbi:MAG TPA: pantoate--beta-alanine ligase [Actinomycetota bacterium]|nr:pantoate--beta-alanine ligase [Actinomycetota bacterium]